MVAREIHQEQQWELAVAEGTGPAALTLHGRRWFCEQARWPAEASKPCSSDMM